MIDSVSVSCTNRYRFCYTEEVFNYKIIATYILRLKKAGDMELKKKRVSKSVFFRLFISIFLVVIPINIILIIYGGLVLHNLRSQAISERKGVMELYISGLDSSVEQMTAAFYRETSSEDMLLLMQSDAKGSRSDIEWHGARNRLLNIYQQRLSDYPVFEGFFSYYDYGGKGENSFVIRSYYAKAVKEINSKIIGVVESDLKKAKDSKTLYHGRKWEHINIEGEDFLMRIWKSRNCYYGGWINLNRLLEDWNIQSGSSFSCFFSDSDGRIISKISQRSGPVCAKEIRNSKALKETAKVYSRNTGIYLLAGEGKKYVWDSVPVFVIILIFLTLLALAAIPFLLFITRKYILRPVNDLLDAMDEVRGGNLDYQIPISHITGEFAILDRSFNSMIRQLRDTKIAAYESEMERQRIQMRYLSQQIQPHFVLNTLNILYSYDHEEYNLIQRMILCLSKYFRYIVKVHSDFVPLSSELSHIKNYFEIQAKRYPESFDYYVEREEGMDEFLIPPLLIQNFTENSIKYAIDMEKKIRIYVLVQFYDKDKMRIRIADTGKGFSKDALEAIEEFRRTHQYQKNLGIGIQNAIERLEIMYKGVPKIMFYNSVEGGATVDIIMPCVRGDEEGKDEDSYDC